MAQPNALNPSFYSISFRNGSQIITGGEANTASAIYADVGGTATMGAGSIYISSGSGVATNSIWVLLKEAWTSLTIN